MTDDEHKRQVMRPGTLLARDHAKTTSPGYRPLGLVEMTPQAPRESLEHVAVPELSHLPVAAAHLKTAETTCFDISRHSPRVAAVRRRTAAGAGLSRWWIGCSTRKSQNPRRAGAVYRAPIKRRQGTVQPRTIRRGADLTCTAGKGELAGTIIAHHHETAGRAADLLGAAGAHGASRHAVHRRPPRRVAAALSNDSAPGDNRATGARWYGLSHC